MSSISHFKTRLKLKRGPLSCRTRHSPCPLGPLPGEMRASRATTLSPRRGPALPLRPVLGHGALAEEVTWFGPQV